MKQRKTGYYWVRWSQLLSGDAWRIAAYSDRFGTWQIIGDDRVYYDTDFVDIDERRVPLTGRAWGYWALLGYCVGRVAFDIYYLITN